MEVAAEVCEDGGGGCSRWQQRARDPNDGVWFGWLAPVSVVGEDMRGDTGNKRVA
jgi:hypothetical protein